MKITQLTKTHKVDANVKPVTIVPTSTNRVAESTAGHVEYEEEEKVMNHELSPEGNSKLARQLKILKTSDPALYDKIVNFK